MAPCGCPHRMPVLTKPKIIPFKPIQANRHKLQQRLMEYFKSTAFNICPHQPLQTMEGKPLEIDFIPGAKPMAVHTPIPVPHHWKKRVKEEMDRDVAPRRTDASRHTNHLVFKDGCRTEKGRISKEDGRLTKTKQCHYERNTLHIVPIQPGIYDTRTH